MKITIAYLNNEECSNILRLLKPILKGARVHKSDVKKPYKHIYITVKNGEKVDKSAD